MAYELGDEQMVIWSGEVVDAISEYIVDFMTYDEVLDLHRGIETELLKIINDVTGQQVPGSSPGGVAK